jgi:hypothetical protein
LAIKVCLPVQFIQTLGVHLDQLSTMGLQYLKTTTAAVAILAAACGSMPGVQAADVASLWGQCGGIGYTGPTQCVSGAVCTHYNDWYCQ